VAAGTPYGVNIMKKKSQYSSLVYQPQLQGKSLVDLYNAIRSDAGLPVDQKAQVINQIKGMTGFANESTPLSALMLRGLGGSIGWLISKYFGMGPVGQAVSAIAGFGMANSINKQLNKPPNLYPGWKM
jgi:hypothetical protein